MICLERTIGHINKVIAALFRAGIVIREIVVVGVVVAGPTGADASCKHPVGSRGLPLV